MKGLEQKHFEGEGKKENNESRTGSKHFRCLKKEGQEKVGRRIEEDGHPPTTHPHHIFIHSFCCRYFVYSE